MGMPVSDGLPMQDLAAETATPELPGDMLSGVRKRTARLRCDRSETCPGTRPLYAFRCYAPVMRCGEEISDVA
ncbi:hypothetical protein BTJ49_05015 [Oleiagrimonas sp. MCCC 1A03011]|nr:hypothetical protein BTJ49_05015 [Oleiagrimonas sp. MCCC 1A03011]